MDRRRTAGAIGEYRLKMEEVYPVPGRSFGTSAKKRVQCIMYVVKISMNSYTNHNLHTYIHGTSTLI